MEQGVEGWRVHRNSCIADEDEIAEMRMDYTRLVEAVVCMLVNTNKGILPDLCATVYITLRHTPGGPRIPRPWQLRCWQKRHDRPCGQRLAKMSIHSQTSKKMNQIKPLASIAENTQEHFF